MDDAATIAAFVSGLLAVVGGFFGAWLTRRSEFEKWYRQEKALVIAEYLRQLHDAKCSSSDAFHSIADKGAALRSHSITEPFVRLEKHAAVLRLFLPPDRREMLSVHQHNLWLSCTGEHGPSGLKGETEKIMQAIQVLLENELGKAPGRWN